MFWNPRWSFMHFKRPQDILKQILYTIFSLFSPFQLQLSMDFSLLFLSQVGREWEGRFFSLIVKSYIALYKIKVLHRHFREEAYLFFFLLSNVVAAPPISEMSLWFPLWTPLFFSEGWGGTREEPKVSWGRGWDELTVFSRQCSYILSFCPIYLSPFHILFLTGTYLYAYEDVLTVYF